MAALAVEEPMLLLTDGPVDDAAEDDDELPDVVAIDALSELAESSRFKRAAATAALCRCTSLAARSRSAAAILAFVS
jgi:hypothetical protein